MSKKCILILPYFGNFKNYFNMFLKSCGMNKKINWLIISDQKCPQNYENIKWINIEFDEFKKMIQEKFEFSVSLDTPYKLCDFKPAYGYVLENYIREYDYWGHCDCDLIFGNLEKMLIPLLNGNYDKLFAAGHLTIYKNSKENNRRFMKKNKQGISLYKIAFSNNKIFGFDEDCYQENVHVLFQNDKCNLYEEDLSFNISTTFYNIFREFYDSKKHIWKKEYLNSNVLVWDGLNILRFQKKGSNIIKNQYLYVHLQMRKMKNNVLPDENTFVKICPDAFKQINYLPDNLEKWEKVRCIYFSLDIFKKFFKERYYRIKSLGKSVKDINPYEEFLYDFVEDDK